VSVEPVLIETLRYLATVTGRASNKQVANALGIGLQALFERVGRLQGLGLVKHGGKKIGRLVLTERGRAAMNESQLETAT
jgi:Mn-dependent DtxR family transcriptional regulator